MNQIAILMATYNGSNYIREQLDSILDQTFQDFKIYIHDDGSTDGTIEIIKKYAQKHVAQITVLDYLPTGNAKSNFLSLLPLAKEPYIMFCDQDDVWLSEKIEITYKKMQELERTSQTPCAVFSDLKVVDQDLNIISNSFMVHMNRNPRATSLKQLLVQNVAPGCTIMINKELAQLAGNYKDIKNLFMHDWWLLLIATLVGRIGYIDKSLILYRQHGNNTVGASKNQIKWLSEKLLNIAKGNQLASSMKGIAYQRKIAYELSMIPGISEIDQKFLGELASIATRSKADRILFYIRNQLIKKDIKNGWKIFIV